MKRRPSRPRALDTSALRTTSLRTRKSLVDVRQFAAPPKPSAAIAALFAAMPEVLAGRDLKELVRAIVAAHRQGKRVVVAAGGHVIKCGGGPILIDLITRGVVDAIALNGGAAVHDVELGLVGRTSEDVATSLADGSFGMARETAALFARAALDGAKGCGLGRALGDRVLASGKRARHSVLAACARHDIPATVHVAIGAEVTHMHPELDGAALGQASLLDFRILASVVAALEGGVWMNVGSAVILPEVFLKAVSLARNLGHRLRRFTTVNLDMIQHYRPRANVLARPQGRAIAITGHHEILLPLLHAGIVSALAGHTI